MTRIIVRSDPYSGNWPSRRSLYYLGTLPVLFPPSLNDTPIHARIANERYIVSIRLAGQICGAARRHHFVNTHHDSRSRQNEPFYFNLASFFHTYLTSFSLSSRLDFPSSIPVLHYFVR